MGGILSQNDTTFTCFTAHRCFFRTLLELPPSTNPLAIVLITTRFPLLWVSCGGSSLRGGSSLFNRRLCRRSSRGLGGECLLFLGSSLRGEYHVPRLPWKNQHRCPTWISSSILSFSVWHSSVECPLIWWYQHRFPRSTFSGLTAFLEGEITSALRASSIILSLSTVKGVYFENRLPRLSLLLEYMALDERGVNCLREIFEIF